MSDPREMLIDLWMRDAGFRERFRADPSGAVKAAGVSLSPADLEALSLVDPGLTDQALQERISRINTTRGGNC